MRAPPSRLNHVSQGYLLMPSTLGVRISTCEFWGNVLCAQSLCNPMDCSLLGFSVPEIIPARILECAIKKKKEYWSGLPFPTPGDLPHPGIKPKSPVAPALAGGFFTTEAPWGRYHHVYFPWSWKLPTNLWLWLSPSWIKRAYVFKLDTVLVFQLYWCIISWQKHIHN